MTPTVFPCIGSMAQKVILRCDWSISVREAARLMAGNKVSSVVLEAAGQRYIFTIEDLLRFLHEGGVYDSPLSDLQLKSLDCILDHEKSLVVLEHLENTGVSHLGVTDPDHNLVGIVTRTEPWNA